MEDYIKLFKYYKQLGDGSLEQLIDSDAFFWSPGTESNSIAVIIQHVHGNMLSRWTDFLTSDGEKEWRNRDQEFELYVEDVAEIMALWEEGWTCLFEALESAKAAPDNHLVYIRNKGHSIDQAVQRQLAHYAYHVGQIVFLARMLAAQEWESLSIPRGQSSDYNKEAFADAKRKEHFTKQLNKEA